MMRWLTIVVWFVAMRSFAAAPGAPYAIYESDGDPREEDVTYLFKGGIGWTRADELATRFYIYYSTNGGVNWTSFSSQWPTNIDSVPMSQPAGTTRLWRVSAYNADGETFSTNWSFTAMDYPSSLNASTKDTNYCDVYWRPESRVANNYQIERSTNSDMSYATNWTVAVGVGTYTTNRDEGPFEHEVTYYYRVTPLSNDLVGSLSSPIESIGPNAAPPPVYAMKLATINPSTSVNVSFLASDTTELYYAIQRKMDDGAYSLVKSIGYWQVGSWTDTGLTRGHQYTYSVSATNNAGYSAAQEQSISIPSAPVNTPTVWYIDRSASSSSFSGTNWGHAWYSVNSVAWDYLKSGDVVYISQGNYPENFSAAASGTNAPITFKVSQEAGHNAGVVISNMVSFNSYTNIVLDGAKDDAYSISNVFGVHQITNNINLRINYVYGPAVYATRMTSNSLKWAEVSYSGGPLANPQGNGISMSGTIGCIAGEIAYCWIHHNWKDGVDMSVANATNFGGIALHHSVIEKNGDDEIVPSGGGGVDVHDCWVYGVQEGLGGGHPDGLEIYGGYVRIWNNVVQPDVNNAYTSCMNWGIVGGYGNVLVYNNILGDPTISPSGALTLFWLQDTTTLSITNVLFANNLYVSSSCLTFGTKNITTADINGCLVANNIFLPFYGTETVSSSFGGQGEVQLWDTDGVVVVSNLVASLTGTLNYGATSYSSSNTFATATGFTGNRWQLPSMQDPENRNWRLAEDDTAATGTGANLSSWLAQCPAIDKDILGRSRSSAWDIGPFNSETESEPDPPSGNGARFQHLHISDLIIGTIP